jgi:formiminoglutamase
MHPVNESDYTRYRVVMDENGYEMNFLKSLRSGRWWMEVPFRPDPETERHALLPCTYEDYEIAQKQEVPDRWLKAVSRLNV